jgi:hypothetical protein
MKMFEILGQQELIHFAGIITGDKSELFVEYDRNRVEIRQPKCREWISERIDTEKHMVKIFWSTTGPRVEDWLPTNVSFNRTDFCKAILPCLASAVFPDQAGQRKRRIYLHVDHARLRHSRKSLQCVADNKFTRIFHPPYSQDIAPSEFYLFDLVKQRPQTCECRSLEELQENVHEILSSIWTDELEATMQAWMERVRRVITTGGDYL